MKTIITVFIFLFAVSFNNIALANKKGFDVSTDFPIEFDLIIKTLQVEDENFYDEFYQIMKDIDKSAQFMRADDIKQIAKVEIYKALLTIPKTTNAFVDKSSLVPIESLITKTNKPLLQWFLAALKKDINNIIEDPNYGQLALLKNNKLETIKIEHRRLQRKVQLVAPWIQLLGAADEDTLEVLMNKIRPLAKQALININKSYQTLFIQQKFSEIRVGDSMKFFKTIDISNAPIPIQKPAEKAPGVEEILAPVLNNTPVDLPIPSSEDWLSE